MSVVLKRASFAAHALTLAALCAASPFARASDTPILESIDGDQAVYVLVKGESRRAKAGMRIDFWSEIRTGPFASAKLRYPDGSLIVIGRDTRLETQPRIKGPQTGDLAWGQIRGIIAKAPDGPGADPAKPKPIKFLFRTKAATMGVRGTDFVFGTDAETGSTNLYTFEGQVDLARSEDELQSGKVTQVKAGEAFQGTSFPPQGEPAKIARFDSEAVSRQLTSANPELLAAAAPGAATPPPMSASVAEALAEDETGPRLRPLDFQLSGADFIQAKDGQTASSQTVILSANPTFQLYPDFAVRGQLAWFQLKNAAGNTFPAFMFGALGSARLLGFLILEGGIALETWTGGNADLSPVPLARVGIHLSDRSWLERVFVGYSRYGAAVSNQLATDQIEAGVGLHL
jgi:hypothetical protein